MSNQSTWTRQQLFDPETIQKSKTIKPTERLRLLFHRSKYAIEDGTLIRYKIMKGVAYVLEVRRGGRALDGEKE